MSRSVQITFDSHDPILLARFWLRRWVTSSPVRRE